MEVRKITEQTLGLLDLMTGYDSPTWSTGTRSAYRRDILTFRVFVEKNGGAVTPQTFGSFRDSLLESGEAVSSVNRRLAAVRATLRGVAGHLGNREQAAAVGVALAEVKDAKKVAAPVGSERMLTPGELAALRNAATPRLRTLIDFLRATGCRISEAVGVRFSDCKDSGAVVLVRVLGKGLKERIVKIRPALFEEIRGVYQGEEYLFETQGGKPLRREYATHELERLGSRILGRKVFAHALRHTFASDTIRRTGKVEATSRYLGHSDPAVTLRFYVHESLEDVDLGL